MKLVEDRGWCLVVCVPVCVCAGVSKREGIRGESCIPKPCWHSAVIPSCHFSSPIHFPSSDLDLFSFSTALHTLAPALSSESHPKYVFSKIGLVAVCVSCNLNNSANMAGLLIVAVPILSSHYLSPLYLPISFLVLATSYAAVPQ